MSQYKSRNIGAIISGVFLASCGISVPDQTPFLEYQISPTSHASTQGRYENSIINHIHCEIGRGLIQAKIWNIKWIESSDWGTSVTLTVTRLDQVGANAGVSFIDPLKNATKVFPAAAGGNVTSSQSFTLGLGATGAASASRSKTIQFTYRNSDIVKHYKEAGVQGPPSCDEYQKGIMIEGDLKIEQFIYDTTMLAALDNGSDATRSPSRKYRALEQVPLFNTQTEDINFVAAFGGGVNPSWKLINFSGNTSQNLLAGQLTYTNDLVITIGPLKPNGIPLALDSSSQAQHNARVSANAIATSIQAH
ncbi:hypothetical protein [Bradyrhizobium sp. USDA 3256]